MSDQSDKDLPQSRVKKRSNILTPLAIVIGVLLVIGVYLFVQKNPFTSGISDMEGSNDISARSRLSQGSTPATDNGFIGPKYQNLRPGQGSTPATDSVTDSVINQHGQNPNQAMNRQAANSAPPTSGDTSDQRSINRTSATNPQLLIDEINSFYTHVDGQPYVKSFGLKESSKAHFSKLLQKLVDNPPVVIRETDDLFTLLQNTAHFFRILGKKNINLLKVMLNDEKDSFEMILNAFYGLTSQPDLLKKEFSLSIPAHALTDYAGFFLNTMGGRMYLFRRDSTSRMVVSYYSIITIDRATNNGEGGNGIDLRPAIRSLIDDIEIGGSRLQLKDDYLETLYNLEEKYN